MTEIVSLICQCPLGMSRMGELWYFKVTDSERVTEGISIFRGKHVIEPFGGGKKLCNYD